MTEEKWEGFKKPNFGPPPTGYIAGYGRGATGFITRSDIGPAKMAENPFLKQREQDDANYNDAKYDEWSGYSAPLFSAQQLDDEDKQAEQAYNKVDERMDGRRREQRQKLVTDELKKMGKQKPSISEQFSDLKRQLVNVSYDDWLNLPDSADSSLKRQKRDRYVPVPDMLVANLVKTNKLANEEVAQSSVNDFGQAKGIILQSKLDRASEGVPNKTVIDKTGYLTSLNTFRVNDQTYLGDLKKARLLLKSAISTNSKNPETWVSAARVEELDGKLHQARVIINQGIEHCPQSEDLWVEASRLEKPEVGRGLLAKAVSLLPKSEKLWLVASRLETEKPIKRRILRKGLEHNSSSVRLWKELIDEQELSEAKSLLYKAVECLPNEVSLWLALAKLENYETAKSVLNKARKSNPLQPQIWISAAKLEETQSESKQAIAGKIQAILTKAQQVLTKNGSTIKRGDWLEQAMLCEKTDNLLTCEMLVELCCGQEVQPAQLESTIQKEAISFAESGAVHTARFMYRWGINHLSSKRLLEKAILFQRSQNNEQELDKILQLAVEKFGDSQDFWLAIAEKYLSAGDYASALKLLDRGLMGALNKEPLLLKKVKILEDLGELKQAEELLTNARQQYGLRSWIASIEMYTKHRNYPEAWRLCEIIYKKEKHEEVFVLAYTIQKHIGRYEDCRSILEKGVETFDKSIKLWLLLVDHELSNGFPAKARMILQRAKVKNSKNQELHQASVRLELSTKNIKAAGFCLAKGLSECPKSGLLWCLAVELEPRANRKKKASQAMAACPQDPNVNLSVAKIFWKEKKLDKAKKWFEKTVELRQGHGDAWCYFYKFLLENEQEMSLAVLNRLKTLEIAEGRLWLHITASEENKALPRDNIIKLVLAEIDKEMSQIE